MASPKPDKVSSLLDALDNSFSSPQPPQTHLRWRQTTIQDYVQTLSCEPNPGGSQDIGGALDVRTERMHSWVEDNVDPLAKLLSPSQKVDTAGFRLNYDQETPTLRIDQGGPDQAQKMAEFVTKAIDNISHGLTVASARKALGLTNEKDLLPGMEVRLLNHQTIGVAWMLAKEDSSDRGGILADDMGLGKTVQMIATMVKNVASIDEECKSTLIIVPAALLQQWKDEIENKTNGMFTVHIHHGKDKLKTVSDIRKYDIIVTTYHTLIQDFNIHKDVHPSEEAEWLVNNGGVLARAKFYRAVADEAQFIRNRGTRASTSLAHIRAKYRWMLTGTPVTNTLADIYGLLRFGRFRPWNDWFAFDKYIAKVQIQDAPLAGSRTQAILQPILLRRTKDSLLEGKPILELPPKSIDLVKLQFSKDERDLYNSYEGRSKIRLNKFIRERTLVKNHAAILVMILRMRQLCCHPNLILSQTDNYDDPTLLMASESERELGRARKIMGRVWVVEVKKRFLMRALVSEVLDFSDEGDTPVAACPVCQDMLMSQTGRVLTCGHEICFDCLMDLSQAPIAHDGIFGQGNERENIAAEKIYEEGAAKGYRPCSTCKKMVDLTPNKVFKFAAFEPTDEELTNHARATRRGQGRVAKWGSGSKVRARSPTPEKSFEERGQDDSDDDLPDVSSMLDVRPAKRYKRDEVEDVTDEDNDTGVTFESISAPLESGRTNMSDDDIEIVGATPGPEKQAQPSVPPAPPAIKGNERSDSNSPRKDKKDLSQAVIATWRRGDNDMEPSAKMLALLEMLQEWDASGDKTIVYSQWTSMLDLIEILLARHGILNLRFDGKLDQPARKRVLAAFQQPGGPKIILISTKCGGVGLNLVSANRIVNMDLSWNYASESQAYDRVHRIGQEKDVFVKRLVVEDTIEERMLKLQDVKVGLAEAALGEGSGARLHKLSVRDIKYLFGMTPAKKA